MKRYLSVVLVLLIRTSYDNGIDCFNIEERSPIVKRGEPGSYFGYSVAQHKTVENSNNIKHSWILVGAPLGHNLQPGTNRSGAIFKCPVTLKVQNDKDCVQVETDGRRKDDFDYDDDDGVTENKGSLLPPGKDEIKEGQWLGVNVRSQGAGGKVVACAHRYITTTSNLNAAQNGLGLCYSLTKDLEWDEQQEPCKGRPMQHEQQQFGYCQAGTSLALLDDGTTLFGAPGPFNWRGTMFVSNIAGEFLSRDRTMYLGPLNDKPEPIDKYSYLGMSVSAGKYYGGNETYYAAGAPRSNSTGQVYIFKKTYHVVTMNVTLIVGGEQFASNFGYEIATSDINKDGYDDLIVAAPFYYERTIGGAVYVYTNLKRCSMDAHCEPDQKLTAGPLESRFGFAVTPLGDINKDGYNDVAIGAPYEGGGSIYIYLGAKNGLSTMYSQKINLDTYGIRTLGYSLSGGLDLDNNGYPDLLTGAYESDMVILFRTRPIIDISIKVTSKDMHNIDITKKGCKAEKSSPYTCFSFKSCFTIKSTKGLSDVNVKSLVVAETFEENRKYSRVWFKKTHKDTRHSYTERYVTIEEFQKEYCQDETVYIKNNTKDILSPIKFKVKYSLDGDSPNSPILNKTSEYNFTASFQKDCGGDDICESHLLLDAKLILPEESENLYRLDLGSVKEIVLNVNVTNKGESAYEAQVFVNHSSTISYIGLNDKLSDVKCTAPNTTVVSCTIGNPFKTDHQANVSLRFQSKAHDDNEVVVVAENELVFDVHVNSTSNELSDRTAAKLTALIRKRAEVKISSRSTPYIIYGGEIKGESAVHHYDDIGLRVWHRYQVVNEGPWKIQNMDVVIYWPHQVADKREDGKWLLYLDEVPYIQVTDQPKSLCLVEGGFNVLNLTSRTDEEESAPDNLILPDFYQSYHNFSSYYSSDSSSSRSSSSSSSRHSINNSSSSSSFTGFTSRTKRQTSEYLIDPEIITAPDGKKRKYVTLDCDSRTAKCIKITCKLPKMEKGSEVTIQINSRLWNSTLLEDYSKVDFVKIKSKGSIIIPDRSIIQSVDDDIAYAETTAYPDLISTQDTGVSIWIYVGAILLGLLLLVLLIIILWKLGFFKRKRVSDPTLSGNLTKQSEAENLL